MSRHTARQEIATEFGATHIVPERGEAGVARVREITDGLGVDAALECVGTDESMRTAIWTWCGRVAGSAIVGVPHGVTVPMEDDVRPQRADRRRGGSGARVSARIARSRARRRHPPGSRLRPHPPPQEIVAQAYAAMDQRRATKAMLLP
jgi:threonine dehydrogenase-like Zn-dependent dehydrogenase